MIPTQTRSNAEVALIRKAWADKEFKDKLLKDPGVLYRTEMEKAGAPLPANVDVRVLEETDKVFYLVIPKVEIDPKTTVKLDERSNRADIEAALILKAMRDPVFLQTLRKDPKGTYEKQLDVVHAGSKLPADMKIELFEESDKVLYFRLPQPPPQGGVMTEAELEAVAGGVAAVGVAVVSYVTVGAVAAAVLLVQEPVVDSYNS